MARDEPALVPEWLKSSSGTGSNNQFAPSSLHSDDHAVSKHVRNRLSASSSDHDIGHSSFSGQTTSSYFRQSSSSNGSSRLRSYNSFSRSQHDRRYNDYTDPLGSKLTSRLDKDVLRRSRSSLIGSRGDSWSKEVTGDSKNGNRSNRSNGDNLLAGVNVRNVHKSTFERDFPSLGTEERQINPAIRRVPSPGFSTAIQSLPVGSSALIGGDGWTSALVEVQGAVGSNDMNVAPPQQTVSASSPSTLSSLGTGLNMAETVAQRPSGAGTPPLLSVEIQKLEERVMKQSKQLVPMTPSIAKTSVLSPSEKGKPKIGQLHGSQSTNLSLRGGPAKSDVQKTSLGKLQILKPSRELNGISSTAKESPSPVNGSKVGNSPLGARSSAAGSVHFRSSNSSQNFAHLENKPASKTVEKKPSAQAKSRNDFFNLLKKKSTANSPSAVPCSDLAESPSASEKLDEATTKPDTLPGKDDTSADASVLDLPSNGDTFDVSQEVHHGEKSSNLDAIVQPDEEEAAFLRSLGWEEGSGEDEGLTEEEINAFFEQHPSMRQSLELRGASSNGIDQHSSQNGNCCNASSVKPLSQNLN